MHEIQLGPAGFFFVCYRIFIRRGQTPHACKRPFDPYTSANGVFICEIKIAMFSVGHTFL